MAKDSNIIKYRSPFQFNIGVVIFLFIIIYVIFNIFSYFTKKDIAEYQVQMGSIVKNEVYQGIAIRDETVEYATEKGYIDYFLKNVTKASVSDMVYSIDTVGNISQELALFHQKQDMSKETIAAIDKQIGIFMDSYDSNHFQNSYYFFQNINSEIIYSINQDALTELEDKIVQAKDNDTFHPYPAVADGIVVFEVDSYEEKTLEELLEHGWDASVYEKQYLVSNRQINISEPVYRRINSEEWTILLPVTEEVAKDMNEKKNVNIRFCKDGFETTASCSVTKKHNAYYLKLGLRTGVIRYATDRFLDIELVSKTTSGLKIPNSAITDKEFFTIPKEYFTQKVNGLLVKGYDKETGKDIVTQIFPTIYYETETHYYIDSELIAAGEIIQKPESTAIYVVGAHTDSLKGVYNINKGYAVFKQINILYQNEDYSIVKTKTAYGISQYDHIALDASKIKEHELITK